MKRLRLFLNVSLVMVLGAYAGVVVARSRDKGGEIEVSSWRKFNRLTDKYRYAVAMFYYRDKDMREKGTLRSEIDELKRMFRAVSRKQEYENAHVAFLRINLAWRGTGEIADTFGVTADAIPAFLLIKNGDAERDKADKPLRLSGYVTRDALVKFIDNKWHDQLIDEAERIEDERERRAEESRVYWNYNPWPYYGYGWGPWGYPWRGRSFYWYW